MEPRVMGKIKLAPSMMCCDFLNMGSQMKIFKEHGIEVLHIDIMDGSFVPNITLGTDFVRQVKRATDIPLDIHMMTESPERFLDMLEFVEGDYVSIHFESTKHLQRALRMVKDRGAKALVALNPATPVEAVSDVLDDIDGLLIMSVNPGFAGQKVIPHSFSKIAHAREFLDANGKSDAEIEVDGNVSLENAIRMRSAGADIFVLGTSGIFKGDDLGANIDNFRKGMLAGKN